MSSTSSSGPVKRSTWIDPNAAETWPLACVLAHIRAVDRGMSPSECTRLVGQAYTEESRAFPACDPPLKEGKLLLGRAASNPDHLPLMHAGGRIEAKDLGPDAVILPHVHPNGVHTFAIYPCPPTDITRCFRDVWCRTRDVQVAWPLADQSAAKGRSVAPSGCVVTRTKRRGGRKGYDDDALLDEMRALISSKDADSAEGAARQVAGRARGNSIESNVDRLANKYRHRNRSD